MKQLLSLIGCLSVMITARAQFNQLQTQYLNNPFVINPACAGEQGFMSATCSYRRQWLGIEGAPETFLFTMDSPIRSLHHNIGFVAGQDNLAVEHKTIVRLAYAYRITGKRAFFAAGISPGVVFNHNAWQDVVTNSADEVFAATERSVDYTVGFGLFFHSEHIFAGVSGQALTNSARQLTIHDQPIELYGGFRFGKKQNVAWTISSLTRFMTSGIYQCDMNAFAMVHDRIGGGLSWRKKDAVAVMAQVKVNEQFRIGYAYDFTLSHLQHYSSGSHEIVLRYDFGYTVNNTSPR